MTNDEGRQEAAGERMTEDVSGGSGFLRHSSFVIRHSSFRAERGPLRVAVDLSNLRPGGENGGVKPFLLETLLWLARQRRVPLRMLYLTCARTHAEVREELARVEDELICVRFDDGEPPVGDERFPRERVCVPPPPDLLWQLGADVLYCPFGQAAFATLGIGTICTVVDVLHRDFPWTLTPVQNEARERMFQEIVAVADRLQCISHHVASRLWEHYQVPPERTFTTHIAIHQRFGFHAPRPEPTPAAPKPGPFFFYPANAWKHKNHESLLLAYGIYRARALADGAHPWPLVLTGHEDARWSELRALTRTLGLSEAVRFRGFVTPEEFGELWNTAGALVFPSLHEGFGIPLLEAMQHDLPVLTSREGSLPEVGADACLYADTRRPEALAEAMTRLATDPALRAQLVVRGRVRRADFSLARESGHLLDAIVDLARTPPPYLPRTKGIAPDGWTEGLALLELPCAGSAEPEYGRLTLRFHPLPAPRHLRLWTSGSTVLGTFELPPFQTAHEVSVDFRPAGGILRLEIPDADNLDPADPRRHGVHFRAVGLQMSGGQSYSFFTEP